MQSILRAIRFLFWHELVNNAKFLQKNRELKEKYVYITNGHWLFRKVTQIYNLSHIGSTGSQCSLTSNCCGSVLPSVQRTREALSNEPEDNSITLCILTGSKRGSTHRKEVLCPWFSFPAISDGPQAQTCSQALLQPADMTQAFQNTHSFHERLSHQMQLHSIHQFLYIYTEPPNHNRSMLCTCTFFFKSVLCILHTPSSNKPTSTKWNFK